MSTSHIFIHLRWGVKSHQIEFSRWKRNENTMPWFKGSHARLTFHISIIFRYTTDYSNDVDEKIVILRMHLELSYTEIIITFLSIPITLLYICAILSNLMFNVYRTYEIRTHITLWIYFFLFFDKNVRDTCNTQTNVRTK